MLPTSTLYSRPLRWTKVSASPSFSHWISRSVCVAQARLSAIDASLGEVYNLTLCIPTPLRIAFSAQQGRVVPKNETKIHSELSVRMIAKSIHSK